MKLFFVVLLTYGAWAFKVSSKTAVSMRSAVSWRSEGSLICEGPVGNLCTGPDWYWEKYKANAIPSEAVDGSDCSDHSLQYGSLYVGQVHVPNVGIVTGSIHAGSCQVHVYEAGTVHTVCENVNILCSKRKENIRWIKIHKSQVKILETVPGIKLISGGYEKIHNLYIGRHYHDGVRQVGKIFLGEGLTFISIDGTRVCTYDNFEIMVYIPSQCNDPVEPVLPPPLVPECPVYPPCPDPSPAPECPIHPPCPDIPDDCVVKGQGIM